MCGAKTQEKRFIETHNVTAQRNPHVIIAAGIIFAVFKISPLYLKMLFTLAENMFSSCFPQLLKVPVGQRRSAESHSQA